MSERTDRQTSEEEQERAFFRQFRFNELLRGNTITPHWIAGGDSFWYLGDGPEGQTAYRVNPEADSQEEMFDVPRLRAALEEELGRRVPERGLPIDTFTLLPDERTVAFEYDGRDFTLDLDSYQLRGPLMPRSARERDRSTPHVVRRPVYAGGPDLMEVPSPDGRWLATMQDHNLALRSTRDGRIEPLTTDGVEEYAWDVEGLLWSPDGMYLAAQKVDQRHVPRYPIVHWLKQTEEVEWVSYPKAGGPAAHPELYLIDVRAQSQTRIDSGDPIDGLLFPLTWSEDSSTLYFVHAPRTLNPLILCAANARSGEVRALHREEVPTMVNYSDVPFRYTALSDGRFIWLSEREGWMHAYLYDAEGRLVRRLTHGEFPVSRVEAVDEENGWVYLTARAEERLYDTHLYRVDLEGERFQRLSEAPGAHAAVFSPTRAYYLDTHSGPGRPPVVELRRADGTLVRTLSETDLSGVEGLHNPTPEEFTALAADGRTELHGVIFHPPNFDPSRTYPVVESIYGGPQTTNVPRAYDDLRAILPRALSSLGFVVPVIDARGTPGRSKAFHDVVYRNFGRNEIPDHVAALTQAAQERPYMDMSRVGIVGGSWGGYMTIRAMLSAPDTYQVGVAIYPVADLYDHIARAIEPFMGLPQDNLEGYEHASSIRLAGDLQGKLLLLHGTSDLNAPFSASVQMAHAFMLANKPYDFAFLPEENHALEGTARMYAMNAVRRYFTEHLGD